MSKNIHIIAEFLPRKNQEQKLLNILNKLAEECLKEDGCLRYHVTQPVSHPYAPGTSQYKIVLIEEFTDIPSFEAHCGEKHVKDFLQQYVESKDTGLVEDLCVRLFSA